MPCRSMTVSIRSQRLKRTTSTLCYGKQNGRIGNICRSMSVDKRSYPTETTTACQCKSVTLWTKTILAPGILARQKGLLYGEGPFLRSLRFENGEITKEFKDDREIMAWLKDWDYLKYIDAAMTDYLYLKGFFDIKLLERRGRISGQRPRIAALEFVSAKNARLEWADTRRLEDVRHIFVGNFENDCIDTGIQTYPVFDSSNPARYPASAAYNSSYSFARDFYSIPEYWGTLALDHARLRSSGHIQIRYRQRVQRCVSCSFSR